MEATKALTQFCPKAAWPGSVCYDQIVQMAARQCQQQYHDDKSPAASQGSPVKRHHHSYYSVIAQDIFKTGVTSTRQQNGLRKLVRQSRLPVRYNAI